MSQVYTRTVKAVGDIDQIYDRLWAAMRSNGFKIIDSSKPNLIIGERGSLRPTRMARKYPHSLVVAFHSAHSDPYVSFSYLMSDFWDYTPGDQDFFNNEINSIVAGLNVNTTTINMSAADVASQAPTSYVNELRGLAKLRDEGLITASEFDYKKRQLMGI